MIKLLTEYSKFGNLNGNDFVHILLEYITKNDIVGDSKEIIRKRDGEYHKSKEKEYVKQTPISDIKADLADFLDDWLKELSSIDKVSYIAPDVSPYFGFSNYAVLRFKQPKDKRLMDYYRQHKGRYRNCRFKFSDHFPQKTPYRDKAGNMIRDGVDYSEMSFEQAANIMLNKIKAYADDLTRKENAELARIEEEERKKKEEERRRKEAEKAKKQNDEKANNNEETDSSGEDKTNQKKERYITMKKLTIRESVKPRLKFEKDQYDHYTIYDGNEEVGYISCTNYYSAGNQAYRNWTIRIDFGKGETYDDNEIGSIAKAKQTATKLYSYALERHAEWLSGLDD